MTTPAIKPGFLGNLSSDQEEKLQKLWKLVLAAGNYANEGSDEATEDEAPKSPTSPPPRRFSLLSRTQSNISETSVATYSRPSQKNTLAMLKDMGIQSNETKMVQNALSKIEPNELQRAILDLIKHDSPDAMLLRFLRARKWDVPKAFAMMTEALVWRVKEAHVDDQIIPQGELHAAKAEKGTDAKEKKMSEGFLAQMRMGKAFIHGYDKIGRPVVYIRVRIHKPGAQTEEALERYIIHTIESVRLLLKGQTETAAVFFDMTGFSLSNMEYPPVKFILKCFEANYPESLGVLIIHNAPWVFSGVWKLIRGWMDPDIAAKVQFTNNVADVSKIIDPDRLPEELGGNEKWKYEYIEPKEDENKALEDVITRDALWKERQTIGQEFLAATAAWVDAAAKKDADQTQKTKSEREFLTERLRVNYWKIDPYTRARNWLDRTNVIQDGGHIDFYPEETKEKSSETQTANMPAEEVKSDAKDKEATAHIETTNGADVEVAA
ncbi:hypothetical protein N7468_002600 [Penicillium chermesinum]|uniref:CRAL-TRIO domain-containing protein n=1 Tax=Penicillium chermesinum TaxID=63820 RepID=A0A9W9PLZ0_9EURO|nr:uncharacterized protein N7468_002600 [Penicillium chermesinum]KAJ5247617.1 hypothetical protein N7468_002600 [Penicillium chermesinum]